MNNRFNPTARYYLAAACHIVSKTAWTLALLIGINVTVSAGVADIVDAEIISLGDGRYRIDASVLHNDEGWAHYADRWDVIAADGTVLGSRVLAHPHVNEQPFTRSLTLTIPPGTSSVTLRANDSVHGLGGKLFELPVPAP